ncbi:MAG TPA: copper resistance protein CopC [Ktedonosporobacter sp.]|nr:copper resistance protein CopC [Ktedonosporobacter sp.]
MRQRRVVIVILACLLSILAYFGSAVVERAPVAFAHAFVIGSDPVDGSTINTLPSVMRIYFNAPISPISRAHVYSVQDGHLVDVSAAPSTIARNNPRELDTPIRAPGTQPQGSYEVMWTAASDADGHTSYGIIGFNLGYSSTGLSGVPILGPSTSNNVMSMHALDLFGILAIAWEWLILIALTFWVGLLVMESFLLTGKERAVTLIEQARRQSNSLQKLCLGALLLGEVVSLVLRVTRLAQGLGGSGFDPATLLQLLTESSYGLLWMVRVALALIALGLLYWISSHPQKVTVVSEPAQRVTARTGPLRLQITQDMQPAGNGNTTKDRTEREYTTFTSLPSHRFSLILLSLAALLLLTRALSGEAAQVFQPHISAIVFDWLGLVTQSIWFGGLVYLGYVILPRLSIVESDRHAEMLAALLRRFTPFLLAAMGILFVCDLFLCEASLQDVHQFMTDPYGRALLIQLIISAMMVLLSLYALFVVRPRLTRQVLLLPVVNPDLPARRTRQFALEHTRRGLKHNVNMQLLLAAGVLFCAALMFFFAPPIVFPNVQYSNPAAPAPTPATPDDKTDTQTKQIGDFSVSLLVLPRQVGYANTVIITIKDSNDVPVTDAQVQVTTNMEIMDMGTKHATIRGGNPTYIATFDKDAAFSMAGLWDVTVAIQRPGQAPVQDKFQVLLAG